MRFLKVKRNNREIVEPREHLPLFKHCTGGFSCMEFKEFFRDTIPILHAHGIDMIIYEEGK